MAAAVWASSVINTAETAFVFNRMAVTKAIPMVSRKNGFLYAVLGKEETGSTPGTAGFQRLRQITGKNIEWTMLGALERPQPVADVNQNAAATTAIRTTDWGAAEAKYAHFSHTFAVPEDQTLRFTGEQEKLNFMDAFFDKVMRSYEQTLGLRMAYSNISDTTWLVDISNREILGSYVYAIAGNSNLSAAVDWANQGTGSAYGTILRNDTNNADFRGNVFGATGDLTLGKLLLAKNACVARGGNPRIAVAGLTYYTKVEGLVSSYVQTAFDADWSKFQGAHTMHAGMKWVLDPFVDAGSNYDMTNDTTATANFSATGTLVALIDPESWLFYSNMENFTSGLVKDITKKALYVLPTSPWFQLICKQPSANAIIGGITS